MWNTATYSASLKAVSSTGTVYNARGWGYRAVVALGKLYRAVVSNDTPVYVVTSM